MGKRSMVNEARKIQMERCGAPQGWLTLSTAIPRGLSKDLAAFIGRSSTTVRRWREPLEHGSGELSFLDTYFAVAAGLHHFNRPGLRTLLRAINGFAESLDEKTALPDTEDTEAAAQIAKESSEALVALLRKHPVEDQERELLETIVVLEDRLAQIRGRKFRRKVAVS